MKKNNIIYLVIICIGLFSFHACIEEIDEDIKFERKQTIGEYLLDNPEYFGQFYKVLERTEMLGLMNSYGEYTCFAPDNEAVNSFIENSSYASIEDYPLDSLKELVLYQLIEKDTIRTTDFIDGRLRSNNMVGDNLQVRTDEDGSFIVNGVATIQQVRDQSLKNGILHMTNAFITPDKDNVFNKLNNPSLESRFSIFSQALSETGVSKLVEVTQDVSEEYSYRREKDNVKVVIPRRFRFTILAESDETFRNAGINSYEELKEIYDDGKGAITEPTNGLYRFIAYHCLRSIYDESNFEWYSKCDGYEIIEPMCNNTLLQYSKTPEGIVFNRFTDVEGSVIEEGVAMTSDYKFKNILCSNGMIHEIKSVLNIPNQKKYFFKKMRFNVCSFLPELMNIDARGKGVKVDKPLRKEFPDATPYGSKGMRYFDNMTIVGNGGRVIALYDYTQQWVRHQWDEILIGPLNEELEQCINLGDHKSSTRLDVTLTLPPVPEGLWEVRFGFSGTGGRGMVQLYFDDVPSGIPFWMTSVDYGTTGMDEESARKIVYYNSFMFFPTNITDGNNNSKQWNDSYPDRMRKVLGIYNFSEMKHHTMRFKTVEPGQLSLNFVEFIPVEQIQSEGND